MNTEIFIILILTHFVSDYFFHPTYLGMLNKKGLKYWKPTIFHSIQYTIIFFPVLYLFNISLYWLFYLFITHFIVDTYVPVKLWNKYIRNAIMKKKIPKGQPPASIEAVEDQIIHILLLIPLIF